MYNRNQSKSEKVKKINRMKKVDLEAALKKYAKFDQSHFYQEMKKQLIVLSE